MDFKTAAVLGAQISKDYAEDLFQLLVTYQDISASEAASRLGLHIRTAQDFLDAMASLDILDKREVYEKKRPYFRHALKAQRIVMDIDLTQIRKPRTFGDLDRKIREKAHAGASFSMARCGDRLSHVTFWTGSGRDRKEHRINLTDPQGAFLYHLPFPNAEFLSVADIMHKAGVGEQLAPEILDIVDVLTRHKALETQPP